MLYTILAYGLVVLICGLLLWFIAYLTSARSPRVTIWRGIVAMALIGSWDMVCKNLLRPQIGTAWAAAIALLGTPLFVKWIFGLSIWRSVLASIIFWVVVGAGGYFIFVVLKR